VLKIQFAMKKMTDRMKSFILSPQKSVCLQNGAALIVRLNEKSGQGESNPY
jgi:hypothetical protein